MLANFLLGCSHDQVDLIDFHFSLVLIGSINLSEVSSLDLISVDITKKLRFKSRAFFIVFLL